MKKKEIVTYEYNHDYDIQNSSVAVQDKLLQLATFENEDGSISVSSDISLIFNQQRLENRITADELREMMNHFNPNNTPYTAQLDDDTLLETLKSRHIQSLSEVRSWAEWCMENYDNLIQEQVNKVRDEMEKEQADKASADTVAAGSTGQSAATSAS